MSLYVGDCLVCSFGCSNPNLYTRQSPTYSDILYCRTDTINSSDDEHIVLETCRDLE